MFLPTFLCFHPSSKPDIDFLILLIGRLKKCMEIFYEVSRFKITFFFERCYNVNQVIGFVTKAVADASFVIGIFLCQQWDTLKMLVETLVIADKVWEEVVDRGAGRPGAKELRQATFVERQTVSNTPAVTMLMVTLDKGEAETLVLATELGITNVFVDDLRGRKLAQSLGLQAVGVAGILLFAKKKGQIRAVQPFLLQLQQKGFRLSSRLIDAVLEEANETL